VLLILARLLERQGDARGAVHVAERVMNRSERPDADLLNFIAFTLADHGLRADDGERFAWRAVLRGPLNGYVLDTLGWAQHRAGKTKLARETLLRADRLSPHEPEILLHLAVVQRALGDEEAARRALVAAKAVPYDDDKVLARIEALLGELEGSGS
jgi:Flp pilus assembly protein TadD